MIGRQCVILLGGLGTRLGELTRETPKPLLPVGGRPFIDVLVQEALRRGFRDIVLLAGHRSEAVYEYAQALRGCLPAGCDVRVSVEPHPLGTGGALVHAREVLDDQFLLLNGDTWFDFNWLDLALLAGEQSAISARQVPRADRYETLRIGCGDLVTEIVPRDSQTGGQVVNGGVYWLRKSDLLGHPERFSMEGTLLPELARRRALRARTYEGFFLDIGIPAAYEAAQSLVPGRTIRPALFLDRDGVLNHDDDYVATVERFRWVDGAKQAVRLANDRGYYVFVVTNQAGVAKGRHSEADVQALHEWVSGELREEGAWVDDWRYCPFHGDAIVDRYRSESPWRKPAPGMLLDIMKHWPLRVEDSLMVGDTESDMAAAEAAGVRPLMFRGGNLLDFLTEQLADHSGWDH